MFYSKWPSSDSVVPWEHLLRPGPRIREMHVSCMPLAPIFQIRATMELAGRLPLALLFAQIMPSSAAGLQATAYHCPTPAAWTCIISWRNESHLSP